MIWASQIRHNIYETKSQTMEQFSEVLEYMTLYHNASFLLLFGKRRLQGSETLHG